VRTDNSFLHEIRLPLRAQQIKAGKWRFIIAIALFLAILQIEGCYYMQAIRGQFEVMRNRQPIPEVIADETSPDDLKKRLRIVQEAREFAIDELLLPDNKSYRSYADLGRDYVVWNVFAAPEFSLNPKTWCYPVAGCVAYRGYFAEEAARKKAQSLTDDGFDVAVGGVSAYSTLGKFSDPVLNTMMRWTDLQLVSTIFHELAHQKLYIKGDTEFNESFATAVADIGITRWLDGRDESASIGVFRENRELRQSMMTLVDARKADLKELYGSDLDDDLKRSKKQELLDGLSADAAWLIEDSGSGATNWLAPPLNNARLASLALYEGRQEAFKTILRDCNEQLDCFYAKAKALAELDVEQRKLRLDQMAD
jgi:predicted aminopeptidase